MDPRNYPKGWWYWFSGEGAENAGPFPSEVAAREDAKRCGVEKARVSASATPLSAAQLSPPYGLTAHEYHKACERATRLVVQLRDHRIFKKHPDLLALETAVLYFSRQSYFPE